MNIILNNSSTWATCQNTNRDFIGIELDEKYFEIAKERMKNNEK